MADELRGKRIAFLATDGVEEVELTMPWDALAAAGADLDLIAIAPGEINATHRRKPADSFMVDTVIADADVDDYDGLVLPRGVAIRGRFRSDAEAVHFVKEFVDCAKPVASIAEDPDDDLPAFCAKAIAMFSQPASRRA